MWDTGIEQLLRPIGKRAIHAYGDKVILEKDIEITMSGYEIKMHKNEILDDDFYKWLFKPPEDAEFMVNVEVGVPKGKATRWFVGIYYKFSNGEWIDESKLELTSYSLKEK